MRSLLIDRIIDLWKNGNKGSFENLEEVYVSSGSQEDDCIILLCYNSKSFMITYNEVTEGLKDYCNYLSDESLVEWYTTMIQESVLNDLFSDNGRTTLQEYFGC